MKSFLLLFTILFCFMASSCQKPKEAEFKEMKNFKLQKPENGFINSTVDIVMHNPNNIGAKLTESYFDLYINDKMVGNSTQSTPIDVPKMSDFVIPVNIKIESSKLNILSNAMDIISGKKIKIKMVGYCKLKKMGVAVKIPITHEQEEKISLF